MTDYSSPYWSKEFPITSVTREDVRAIGLSKAQIALLTDEDMAQIARAMEDVYCDHGYWEDLELCTNRLIQAKEEKHGRT